MAIVQVLEDVELVHNGTFSNATRIELFFFLNAQSFQSTPSGFVSNDLCTGV